MSENTSAATCTLVTSCPDRVGLVSKVSSFVAAHDGSLLESNNHTDAGESWFYMRNVIDTDSLCLEPDQFRLEFTPLAEELGMQWYGYRNH